MIIPRIVLGGVTRGMMIPRRVCSRRHYHVLSLFRRPQPAAAVIRCPQKALLQQQLARKTTITTTLRRRYYSDYGENSFNQPTFSPAEELVMDMTAWFVAFTLIAIPSIDEPLDDDEEEEKEEHRNPPRRRPTAHFDDWVDYQSLEELEDEADRRREQQLKQRSNNATKSKSSTNENETPKQDHHH